MDIGSRSDGGPRSLVLVTGSGRSGTSSLAGSLKRLGLHIPPPEVEADDRNQRGFYEPAWVIAFHKRYLKRLAMHNIDSRPSSVQTVADLVATGEPAAELGPWLAEQHEPQLLVKDPHAFWFGDVWRSVCADQHVDLRWLTALRHPAEVVGSRDLAYLQHQPAELRLVKETSNVAGWLHAALLTERAGRGQSRSFVRYVDLLADWRPEMTRIGEQLKLDYTEPIVPGQPHAIDDFLDSGMRRSEVTWDDISVPAWLRDLTEEVWQLLGQLVDDPHDVDVTTRLDEIHGQYVAAYTDAMALVYDHSHGESVLAARKAREAQADKMAELRARVEELGAGSRPLRSRVRSRVGALLRRR